MMKTFSHAKFKRTAPLFRNTALVLSSIAVFSSFKDASPQLSTRTAPPPALARDARELEQKARDMLVKETIRPSKISTTIGPVLTHAAARADFEKLHAARELASDKPDSSMRLSNEVISDVERVHFSRMLTLIVLIPILLLPVVAKIICAVDDWLGGRRREIKKSFQSRLAAGRRFINDFVRNEHLGPGAPDWDAPPQSNRVHHYF